MGIVLGIGNLRIGSSGQSWSWTGKVPTNLTAVSYTETEAILRWTDSALPGANLRIKISTDNVTFTEKGTALYGSKWFVASGLTAGTLYYFQLVAYHGTSESDAITASVATVNSALVAGWDFETEVVPDAFSSTMAELPFHPSNYSPAAYYNGKTYISYSGDDDDPYIVSYTHATGVWSVAVKIGEGLDSEQDDHGQPAILIDNLGSIHCIWGAHNSAFSYAKSNSPEDISAWTAQASPATGTYPQLIQFSNNTIYLFYRSAGVASSYWGYRTSADNGGTWSDYVQVSQDFAYCIYRKGVGDTVHCVMYGNNQTSADRKNVYYIFFNGTNWVNISGDIQPTPAILAGNNCIAYNSADKYTPSATIGFDSANNPIILFPESVIDLDLTEFNIKILKHNGTAWETFDLGVTSEFYSAYISALDVISDTVLHAYVVDGDTALGTSSVEKWISSDAGETWALSEVIKRGCVHWPVLIKDHHVDARIIFTERAESSYIFINRGWVYGDSGLIANAATVGVPEIRDRMMGVANGAIPLVAGEDGNCYKFEGNPDRIFLKHKSFMSFAEGTPDAPFSVSFMANMAAVTNNQIVVAKGINANREYQVYFETGRIILLAMNQAGTVYIGVSAPYTTLNAWVEVCCTYNGDGTTDGMKIYVEETELQDATITAGTYLGMTSTANPLYIGCYRAASGYLIGYLDKVRIWNKALTTTEWSNVLNGITPIDTPLTLLNEDGTPLLNEDGTTLLNE